MKRNEPDTTEKRPANRASLHKVVSRFMRLLKIEETESIFPPYRGLQPIEKKMLEVKAERIGRYVIAKIDAEPGLPGDMPDEMWEAIRDDRDAAAEAMRIVVRQTKQGIINRLSD